MATKTRKAKPQLPPIRCKCGCEEKFVPKDGRHRYINTVHRKRYYEANYFAPVEVTKICPWCGKKFITTKPETQIYCPGGVCREEHRDAENRGDTSNFLKKLVQLREDIFNNDGYQCVMCGLGRIDKAKLYVNKKTLQTNCEACMIGAGLKEA